MERLERLLMPIICIIALIATLAINAGETLVVIIGRSVIVLLALALVLGFIWRIRYRLAEEKWRRDPEVAALLEEKHQLQEELKQMAAESNDADDKEQSHESRAD